MPNQSHKESNEDGESADDLKKEEVIIGFSYLT
jgi:hypothetical protein